jgi:hypothetical protein
VLQHRQHRALLLEAFRERACKYGSGFADGDVPASKHEGSNPRGLQGQSLKAAIANPLVARQNDPVARAGERKPRAVVCAFREVAGQPFNRRAGRRERLRDRVAVQRLVEKER